MSLTHPAPLAIQLAIVFVAASPVLAQVQWQSEHPGRTGHRLAWHERTGTIVRYGGSAPGSLFYHTPGGASDETYVRAGGTWHRLALPVSPPPCNEHSLTEYPPTGDLILFGGQRGASGPGATWAWNGTTWSVRSTAAAPTARSQHGASYDVPRQRIVLFGGVDAVNTQLADTWEFDGVNWLARSPSIRPPGGPSSAMAWNPVTSRTVLYQGTGPVWEWDGTAWFALTSPTALTASGQPIFRHSLVTDPFGGGILLTGGDDYYNSVQPAITARWDGTSWTQLVGTEVTAHAVALDPRARELVAYGGIRRFEGFEPRVRQTWTWNGVWHLVDDEGPTGSLEPGIVEVGSSQKLMVFGGLDSDVARSSVWLRAGGRWEALPPLPMPTSDAGVAYDSGRDRVVVFGGCSFNPAGLCFGLVGQTFEWDGTRWQTFGGPGPTGRQGPRMAYDPVRQRTVLFGGSAMTTTFLDTWEWDGAQWLQRQTNTVPPAVGPMAHAGALGVVMHSGGQIWSYDGNDWQALFAAPPATRMVFDAGRQRLVLLGFAGVQERVGNAWVQRLPIALGAGPAAWSSDRRTILTLEPDGSLWEYGPIAPGRWSWLGQGCPAGVGTVTPQPRNDPYVGEAWLLDLQGATATVGRIDCVGFSSQSAGGLPLPIDLTPIGMPGCWQRIAIDQFDVRSGNLWTLAIPATAGLIGLEFFAQSLVAAPGANPLGAIASTALRGVVGAP